jgi:crotonobetainyl-CoA:carnitine CoA-transferase CaiB-like acyl-CoA transferase
VTENFAPGVMERWGLTYDYVKTLVPNVIMARMSGFGHSGPHAEFKSFGPVVQAVSGLSYISGLPGQEPSGWGMSYMDNMAAFYNSSALLMAIYHRNNTGEGTEIDVSAIEAGINLVGPVLLDVSVNGRRTRDRAYPPGNRLEFSEAAPHGVFPTRGDDRWIAISVFNEEEWQGLVAEMGSPAWAFEPRFATQADRYAHQDALEEALAAFTITRERYDLMHRLQARGVAASVVQNAEDLNEHYPQTAAQIGRASCRERVS